MRYETTSVTPGMATAWLKNKAPFQRKLREATVAKYARDMSSGAWNLTHQGIAFDTKGRLIDGQHRLSAIVKSATPVKMVVIRDVPAASYDHVDLGMSRNVIDVLKSNGEHVTNDQIATVRFIDAGAHLQSTVAARSPFEISDMLSRHKNALSFIFQTIERHVKGVTIAPVLAAVGVAYYCEEDRAKLTNFLRLLVSGIAQDPATDSTVIRLRDWLRDRGSNGSATARMDCYMKTQRVIKAYMNNETLSKLHTPSQPCYVLDQHKIEEVGQSEMFKAAA